MMLKIVPVTIFGTANASIETHALPDEGPTLTLVDVSLAKAINVSGRQETLFMVGVGGSTATDCRSETLNLEVAGIDGTRHTLRKVRRVRSIGLSTQHLSARDLALAREVVDIPEAGTYNEATPKILIGQDNWELIISRETILTAFAGLAVSHTALG